MKKIYTDSYQSNCSFRTRFFNRISLLLLGLFCMAVQSAQSQVNLTATAGSLSGTYPTLGAAFTAINGGTHQGVITITISGSTTESATAQLNGSGIGSASYTSVTITPTAASTISGNIAGALVRLNGADNVSINGILSGTRQLTFNNTNASNTAAVIWVSCASATDGANGNVIRNCIVTGGTFNTTLAGIAQSGTTLGNIAEIANNNNTYQNNLITTAQYGIAVVGPTGNETGTVIRGNQIGSSTNKIYFRGIFIAQQQDVTVTQNTIQNVDFAAGSTTLQASGIYVVGTISGGTIDRNNISNIRVASFWGCNGIQLNSSSASTGLTITNNFIYDIVAGGFGSFDSVDDNGTGIAVNTGGDYRIYYNSINLTTNQSTGITAAIWLSSSTTVTNIKLINNIFANSQTNATRYAIISYAPASAFSAGGINYNDYYNTGTNLANQSGTVLANLAAWQGFTGQDANSVNLLPQFTSTTDLHLIGSSPLNGLAVNTTGITSDYDGDTRDASTPDIGADEFTPPGCTGNNGGTASASSTSLCASGSVTLSSTGYSFGVGNAYQWEFFNGSIWVSLSGQTNPASASTGTITATTQYRLRVTCNAGVPGYSNIVTVTVNNPTVTSTTPGSRCGNGTVSLAAVGSNVKWYDAPTGGTLLGSGSPFTTPVINSTTIFYVSASVTGSTFSAGKTSTAGADGGYNGTGTGLVFDASATFTLQSVKMYPLGASTITVEAQTSAGALIPGCSATYTFAAANTAGEVVPLNFNIPIGTGHRLLITTNSSSASFWRDFSGNSFPYTIGTFGNITTGYLGGFGTTNTYYFFYDWQVIGLCEGLRTPVTATVVAPPAITPTATPNSICSGANVNLNVTSSNAGYTYVWTPGSLSGAAQTVTPASTTTYTITATDNSGGAFNGCVNVQNTTVTVNTTPSAVTVTPASASICSGTATPLTVTGGLVTNQTIIQEQFESFPLSSFTVGGTGVTAAQNSTYYQSGASSILLTAGNSADGDIRLTNNINLTTYAAGAPPSLSFYHIAGLEGNLTAFDFGYIQYSTDGGTSWTSFPTTSYTGSGALFNSVVSFSTRSYSDWIAQFASTSSTPGAGPATALWKKEVIDLSSIPSWATQTTVKIRFRLTTDGSVLYYGWLIDSVRIAGTAQASINWSPTTFLSPTSGPNVTSTPTANVTYTVTATAGVCSSAPATSVLTVISSGTPAVSIAASPGTSVCAGSSVTFTATPTLGGATPNYRWWKAYSTTTVAAPIGSNTLTLASVAGLAIGMPVFVPNGLGTAMTIPTTITNIAGNVITLSLPTINTALPIGTAVYSEITAGSASGSPSNTYTTNTLVNGDRILCTMNPTASSCGSTPVSSSVLTMTVNPLPNSAAITGSNTVCNGAPPTVLTANATVSPGSIATYEWFLNGSSQGAPSASSTFNATAAGTYTYTATSVAGCSSSSPAFAVTLPTYTITATAGPNGTISPSGAVTVNCGDNQTFTFTPNAFYGIQDVLVDGVSVGTPASYTFTNVTAPHTISVTFFIAGCANPPTASAGSNASICAGQTYTLAGSIGGSATVGTWSGGTGTFNPNNTTVNAIYTPSAAEIAAGTVSLTLTTNNPNGAPCVASTSSIVITIKAIPTVSISGTPGFCPSGNTTLTASASITPSGPISYSWSPGSATTAAITVNTANNYTVTATGNGCSNTASVNVVAFTSPSVSITGSNVICTNVQSLLTASVTAGSGSISPTAFTWRRLRFGGSDILSATSSTLLTNIPGNYTVSVVDDNGCSSAVSASFSLSNENTALNGNYTISSGSATCTNYTSFASAITDLNNRGVSSNVRFLVSAGFTDVSQSLIFVPALMNSSGTTIYVNNTRGLVPGMTVTVSSGTGAFQANTTITSISNDTTFVVSLVPSTTLQGGINNASRATVRAYLAGLQLGSAGLNSNISTNNYTLSFEKSGSGANPIINSYTTGNATPSGGTIDGIFAIRGTDNVTIQQIDLNDVNSAGNATMEYGYGLFKFSTTDGVRNASIVNCTISLSRNNTGTAGTVVPAGSTGIVSLNSVITAANTALLAGGAVGTNSNNKFYGNTIQNCNNGIALVGLADVSPFTNADTNNDIGGSSGTTGNTIQNLGNNNTLPVSGITVSNQWGLNISYNTINNDVAGTINHSNILRGITTSGGTSASITISNNSISLNSASTAQTCYAIENAIGSTAASNTVTISSNTVTAKMLQSTTAAGEFRGISNSASAANVNINSNSIINCRQEGLGQWTGITHTAGTVTNISMVGNQVINDTINSTNINCNVINSSATTFTTQTISNNTVSGIIKKVNAASTLNLINLSGGASTSSTVNNNILSNNEMANTGTTGTLTLQCIVNAAPNTYSVNGNTITNNRITGIGNAAIIPVIYGLRSSANTNVPQTTITNNAVSRLYASGTVSNPSGSIIVGIASLGAAASVTNINNNRVDTLYTDPNMAAIVYGIQYSNAIGTTLNVFSNNIGFLTSGLAASSAITNTVEGIRVGGISSGGTVRVYQDSIYSLTNNHYTTSSGNVCTVNGIGINGGILAGVTVNVYRNVVTKLAQTGNPATGNTSQANGINGPSGLNLNLYNNRIYDISASTSFTTPGAVNGINMAGTLANQVATVYNNFISDLRAPQANNLDAIRGINVSASGTTSTYNVWYNTIYLNATSSGTNFGTAAIYHLNNATSTTTRINLRNNILVNLSTPNGTGLTAAVRRSGTSTPNNLGTINNNVYWSGASQASPNVLWTDGTSSPATLVALQGVTGQDAASKSGLPVFINVATTPFDLHLKTDANCDYDGQGDNTGIANATDYDNDARNTGTPNNITDIGADEFASTGSGPGVWRGVNSNWLDVNNWCGSIPTATTDVTIPNGASFYPIIGVATPVVRNLTINTGGTVTVNGAGKLAIYGTISNSGTFDVSDGTIEMAGSSAQTIPSGAFAGNNIKNLIINNATVNLGGPLNLLRKLSFTGNNRTFATAGNLTIKSTATRTGWVGDITNNGTNSGNQITGDVTVERFATARRAWRLLAVPTQHNLQTIKEAWQENQAANAPTPSGFGINIPSDRASWSGDGFDQYTPTGGPSLKTYNPATNAWVGVISTVNVVTPTPNNGRFVEGEAYMTFVRGDRTVNAFGQGPTTTVLREKGALRTGNFGAVTVGAGQFKAVGNPYASSIDFTKLTRSNLQDVYYLWDPLIGSLGGYQTFLGPTYTAVPGGGSYASGNKLIESGSGFFVRSNGPAGSVTFTEPCKVDTNYLVQRETAGPQQFLRTNLYQATAGGTPVLVDGVMNRFDPAYSNNLDDDDAIKLGNFNENLGLKKDDKTLVVESRSGLTVSDTIQFQIGQVRAQTYQFEFIAENLSQYGLEAFLEDKFLNTKTPVNMVGGTVVPFTVINEAGSYASDRFRLVFKLLAPVPVSFTNVKAEKANNDILVSWKVENESQIDHYEVEKSGDGRSFSKIGDRIATGNGGATVQYNWLDRQVLNGYNYYRIRSIGLSGEVKFSEIVKINVRSQVAAEYAIYPNPVREDGIIQVSLDNAEAGKYMISLYNNLGQLAYRKQLIHGGGSSVYSLDLGKDLAHGHYRLELRTGNNDKRTFNIIY